MREDVAADRLLEVVDCERWSGFRGGLRRVDDIGARQDGSSNRPGVSLEAVEVEETRWMTKLEPFLLLLLLLETSGLGIRTTVFCHVCL